jgi:hypothetical protein
VRLADGFGRDVDPDQPKDPGRTSLRQSCWAWQFGWPAVGEAPQLAVTHRVTGSRGMASGCSCALKLSTPPLPCEKIYPCVCRGRFTLCTRKPTPSLPVPADRRAASPGEPHWWLLTRILRRARSRASPAAATPAATHPSPLMPGVHRPHSSCCRQRADMHRYSVMGRG